MTNTRLRRSVSHVEDFKARFGVVQGQRLYEPMQGDTQKPAGGSRGFTAPQMLGAIVLAMIAGMSGAAVVWFAQDLGIEPQQEAAQVQTSSAQPSTTAATTAQPRLQPLPETKPGNTVSKSPDVDSPVVAADNTSVAEPAAGSTVPDPQGTPSSVEEISSPAAPEPVQAAQEPAQTVPEPEVAEQPPTETASEPLQSSGESQEVAAAPAIPPEPVAEEPPAAPAIPPEPVAEEPTAAPAIPPEPVAEESPPAQAQVQAEPQDQSQELALATKPQPVPEPEPAPEAQPAPEPTPEPDPVVSAEPPTAQVPEEPAPAAPAEQVPQEPVAAQPEVPAFALGQVWRDCTNCPEMVAVVIPPTDGNGEGIKFTASDNSAAVEPFAIGRFEITFDEWALCVAAGACKVTPADAGLGAGLRPVINVSHEMIASQYLPWLSEITGKEYRLPTSVEWDLAEAGGAARLNQGIPALTAKSICKTANFALSGAGEVTCDDTHAQSAPVGSLEPNALGLHDMRGNVWEWVSDCWTPGFNYKTKPSERDCRKRLVRGGSWSSQPVLTAAAPKGFEDQSRASKSIGFRVARSLP